MVGPQATYPVDHVAPAAVVPALRVAGVAEEVVQAVAAVLLAPAYLAGGVSLATLGPKVLRDKTLPGGPVLPSVVETVKKALAAVRG